jgi:hypothetical protein
MAVSNRSSPPAAAAAAATLSMLMVSMLACPGVALNQRLAFSAVHGPPSHRTVPTTRRAQRLFVATDPTTEDSFLLPSQLDAISQEALHSTLPVLGDDGVYHILSKEQHL